MASRSEIFGTLAEGRAEMESLMLATCRITRPAEPGDPEYVDTSTIDEATGQYPAAGRVVVYGPDVPAGNDGRCRIQVKADINSNVVETTAGEREWTYLTMTLQLPIAGSEAVRPDNICELLTSPEDTSLEGRLLNIQGMYHKSAATHRRFRVREVIA
jgi:hypothetical protein